MFTFKKFVVALSLFTVSCGYSPLYPSIQKDMEKVTVGEVRMKTVAHKVGERRVAQVVNRKLAQSLDGNGEYVVNVAIEESVATLAVRRDATDQRLELNLLGDINIIEASSGKTIFEHSLTTSVAYNVEDAPFATDAGKERARTSAAIALSNEIMRSISLYFRQQEVQ